jgi:hypothetical protein
MSTNKRLAKVVGLAIVAVLAISAFASASASAAQWTVEGAKIKAEGEAASAKLKTGTSGTLTGTLLGQEFVLTASALKSESGLLFQEGTKATFSGFLSFSGFTVHKPAGCKVKEPIKTRELTGELVDHAGSEHAFARFRPSEIKEGKKVFIETFATVTVEGCAVAGSYQVKTGLTTGVYGEAEKWGTSLAEQPLKFTPAINATPGGTLTLGTSVATLSAEGVNTLTSGKKFSADT